MKAVPERIGKFTIEKVLGQGAMGVVYQGFDPHIHRRVAIKTVRKELRGDGGDAPDSIAARFRNEAQAVGRIHHPGVVAIYDFGEDEEQAYIAMEFVEGRNLEQILAGTPLLPEAQLLHIMDQLLEALAAAHAQGVWHRDIKPANLLITASGQVKLTDFGIARIADMGLTQVASMIGTPGYMAPEQYTGRPIDQRADIFAAGVLLYRLLTGRPAFSGTAEAVMYQIVNEAPVPPSELSLGRRPKAYDAIVSRAIAKRPDERYSSAAEFRRALAACAAHSASAGDATVIVPPGHWARAVEAAASAHGGAPQGSSGFTQSAPPTGWDAQVLSRIERSLASFVGPMAKLMVRNAAKHCHDVASLANEVAQHIGEEKQRQQFIATATGGTQLAPRSGATALGSSATQRAPATNPPATQLAGEPLTDEFKAHALQVLARHLGPIAKVVVKRTAERTHTRGAFITALLDAAEGVDRTVLQRELGN
ncbi:serine/threonine-protein kinase [Paucibacter sp. R3-3]|uniref:Serine/threonine-protein kinase n=1 Tax=Roseateles agri TaxID=3098619 RepID=A0ABU5DI80_9BURK|nr:serine/threonine-protein kinase [Paucibacter sp. R3-3]MDY0745991.1 serine/threonine-protein kinase [Paucibacter sp. R3-3]